MRTSLLFFALVLIKELVLNNNKTGTNKNYISVHKTNNQVISGHITILRNKFNLVVDEENKKLPNIDWTPKLYKYPSKARLIIAALQCSVKLLSKAVTSVLKRMHKQIETYNSKMHYFSGVKSFWPVQNNQPVIDAIKKFSSRNKALSISTYDVSTLFKGAGEQFIVGTKFDATRTDGKNKFKITFEKASLILAINFLLNNFGRFW